MINTLTSKPMHHAYAVAFKNCGLSLLVLFVGLFISSCSTQRKATKTVTVPIVFDTITYQSFSSESLIDSLYKYSFNAATMSAKADVVVSDSADKKEFNASMRLQRDTAIWISINAILGVEVARVLITPDSVFVMDRLNKKFVREDYKYLNQVLKLKVDFNTIQNIMTGNFFQYRNENKFHSVYVEDKWFILSTLNKRKLKRSLEDKDPNKPIVQDLYINPGTFRISQLQITDEKLNKHLTTDYTEFESTQAGLLPQLINTQVSADKKMAIEIRYTKVTVNLPLEMPFNIPQSYEPMQPR